ncbi:MAG: hypothetical protein RIQ89_1450 [Bacteroidota bacterium]|jgi:molecular chaperone GrpE
MTQEENNTAAHQDQATASTEQDQAMASTEKENKSVEASLTTEDENEQLKAAVAEQKDKFLRLFSEFENYKRRTTKEKLELLKSGGEDVFKIILPIIDDMERAISSLENVDDPALLSAKEGILLIYQKLLNSASAKGLSPMQAKGTPFNPDLHEALSNMPVTDDGQKGMVVEELEKGYYLNDKVIRYAKVIVGA